MSILTADFDQIELRVIAALANEPAMIEAAKKGISLHLIAANKLFGEGHTPDQYKLSKNINFTWAFGGGAQKMSDMYSITIGQARELIAEYENQFPALREYKRREQNKILQSALTPSEYRALRELRSRMYHFRQDTVDGRRARVQISLEIKRLCFRKIGWTVNAFGRRLPVDAEKPYTVVNYNVQSTARDIMAHALLRVMADPELEPTVLLPIHDEILGQAPKRDAQRIAERYGEVMTTTFMGVPITASGKVYGKSWGHGYRTQQ
jgi:DNA polymerase-1